MIGAILIGLVGVLFLALGVLYALMAFMPKFGGGDEAWVFPVGLAFFAIGTAMIFWAGSLA